MGFYLSSGYEYPGRYSRWDFASTCPPLEIISYDRRVEFRPLNARGVQIASIFHGLLADHPHWDDFGFEGETLAGRLKPLPGAVSRGRAQQTAIGIFDFAGIDRGVPRRRGFAAGSGGRIRLRSAVPVRADRKEAAARRPQGSAPVSVRRHLVHGSQERAGRALSSTSSSARVRARAAWRAMAPRSRRPRRRSAAQSRATTRRKSTWRRWRRCAKACAAAITTKWCCARPSTRRTPARRATCSGGFRLASPSPYEFLLQFGEEQLVGASPEMFRAVEGARIETCPIAGTAQRTGDPLRDADNIRELLDSPRRKKAS